MSDSQYFAAKEGKDTANIVLDKANKWFTGLDTNGYLDTLRSMYAAYYGAYYTDGGDANSISFGGEQGELVNIAVNHLRNLGEHMLTIITSVRPKMQARAVNTDYKSIIQTQLANGILDYYMREKRLEYYIKTACEMAIVLGSGYVKAEWNSTSGEVHDFDEELKTDIREGEIEFSNLSPLDVFFDLSREDQKHDWITTRSWKNKFDVAAKYPEFAEEIKGLQTKSQIENFYMDAFYGDDTEVAKRVAKYGRVVFSPKVPMKTSARRFAEEGTTRITLTYLFHFFKHILSQFFLGFPSFSYGFLVEVVEEVVEVEAVSVLVAVEVAVELAVRLSNDCWKDVVTSFREP